ncbi:MAG: hypothetical protein J6S22_04405, partial [Clostridia bacterium]|nr:hypothetical protein [Clostridia bacterium]
MVMSSILRAWVGAFTKKLQGKKARESFGGNLTKCVTLYIIKVVSEAAKAAFGRKYARAKPNRNNRR